MQKLRNNPVLAILLFAAAAAALAASFYFTLFKQAEPLSPFQNAPSTTPSTKPNDTKSDGHQTVM